MKAQYSWYMVFPGVDTKTESGVIVTHLQAVVRVDHNDNEVAAKVRGSVRLARLGQSKL